MIFISNLKLMTYSLDFRQKVLSVKAAQKLTFLEVLKRFQIEVNRAVRWSKKIEPKLNLKNTQQTGYQNRHGIP